VQEKRLRNESQQKNKAKIRLIENQHKNKGAKGVVVKGCVRTAKPKSGGCERNTTLGEEKEGGEPKDENNHTTKTMHKQGRKTREGKMI